MTITQETFAPFAFPVARVRYHEPTDYRGARWIATIRRDNERTFRATVPYDDAVDSGARNAIRGATACLAKALAAIDADTTVADYVAIPGDLDADTYAFTFVPRYLLNRE